MSAIIEQALEELRTLVECREGMIKVRDNMDVINYLKLKLAAKTTEYFGLILLSQQNKIISMKEYEDGIENRCHVYVKKIVREVLNTEATGVIFYHNHPSGNSSFSKADIVLTKTFKKVFDPLEIRVLDHILVTRDLEYYSMNDLHLDVFCN
jgi:DNA repair protein RadC